MRRSLKNLIVFAMAFVLLFAMSITAFAASEPTPVKSIKIVNEGTAKKVSAATLYVNGNGDGVDDVHLGENVRSATPVTMTFDLDITGKVSNVTIDKNLSVATKNRGIATAQLKTVDGKDKLVVTATGIGKTTITVTDADTKKSAKMTVTVKKLVESISLGVAQETDEMTGKSFVHLERKGKVNLLASASADASTKALKYVVMENKVLKDGKWIESTTVKKKKTVVAPVVTVDKKGNVTGVDEKRADVEMAKAVVRVYATDQKVINSANKAVTTGVYEDVLVYVYPKTYASKDIIQFTNLGKETNKKLGKTNTYKAQTLYTNATDTAHTLKVDAAAYKKDGSNYVKTDLQKVTYTTSNAKVATVSADGVVTAVGNGKAVISAVPAYGFATPKATVQVIVKTKPEVINVPADVLAVAEGKTVKLNASIAKNASYKKLTYTVEEGSEFVKLNAKKGTVKGLAEGIAKIKVSTVADEKGEYPVISRRVTVQVSTPVNAITLTDAADKALPKTITLYAYDKANFKTEAPSEYTLKATVTGEKNADDTYKIPSNKNVDFVPSKASVADVSKMSEDMATVYANGKGKATVTVVAQDGSNKKATAKVNVIQLVDEINVVNGRDEWLEGTEKIIYLNVVKGQTTTIKASANADANNKKLANPTIVDGATAEEIGLNGFKVNIPTTWDNNKKITLEIKATDGVKLSEEKTTVPFAQKVVLCPVDEMKYADKAWITATTWTEGAEGVEKVVFDDCDDVSTIVMKKGTTAILSAEFEEDVVDRTAKWSLKAGKKKVVVKNGVVTAKNVTDDAVVVLTYKTGANKKDTATKEVKVRVIPSDVDYKAALSKNIKAKLNAEDRTYLGAKVSFNEKVGEFNVQITNPSVVITDLKDTGILSIFESLIDVTTNRIEVSNWGKDAYSFERANGSLDVNIFKNGEFVTTAAGFDAIGEFLKAELEVQGYATFADMNGVAATVKVYNQTAKAGDRIIENTAEYQAFFNITDADMDAMIDERIQEELAVLNASEALESAGIASVDYNAALNVATVNIKNGKVTVEAAEESAKAEVVEALKTIFAEVTVANVNVEVTDFVSENESFNKNEDGDLDTAIEKLFVKVREEVGATTEIGMFEGGRADARVTYSIGVREYNFDYVVNFARTATAVDAQVDERIAKEITNIDTKDTGLTAEYNAETNALTVKMDKTENSVLALQDTGLFAAIENTLKDVAKANAEVSAVVVSGENETTIDDLANVTKAQLEEAFGLTDDIKLVDLLDDNAVITVVYPQISGDVRLTYTVNYEMNMDLIDAEINAVITNAIADAKVADEVIADVVYENHAIQMTLDAAKNKPLKDADALYEVFKAAVPVNVNGISAVSATFAGNEYQKMFDAEALDKLAVAEILAGVAGVDAVGMISDLDGVTMSIKVVYNKYGVECAIVYNVAIDVINKPVQDIVIAEEVTEVTTEETTEETVEEATEETAEEATEETAEETAEATTEETTEETAEATTEETTEEIVEETTEEVVETVETTEEVIAE